MNLAVKSDATRSGDRAHRRLWRGWIAVFGDYAGFKPGIERGGRVTVEITGIRSLFMAMTPKREAVCF